MTIEDVRNILYCHLMDLEANHPGTCDYDIWNVKQALSAAVEYFENEMNRYRKS